MKLHININQQIFFKMKSIYLILTILIFFIFSCQNCYLGGNVPYEPCQCKERIIPISFQGEAYLFEDFIPEKIKEKIDEKRNRGVVSWIVFDSKTNLAILHRTEGAIYSICEICNYPNFAKEWKIPINGAKVFFDGTAYMPCIPKGSIGTVSHYDLILSYYKIK